MRSKRVKEFVWWRSDGGGAGEWEAALKEEVPLVQHGCIALLGH